MRLRARGVRIEDSMANIAKKEKKKKKLFITLFRAMSLRFLASTNNFSMQSLSSLRKRAS
jgi:hypothetical protein